VFSDNFITTERIGCHNQATSKKRALQNLSELLAKSSSGLSPDETFEKLLERERLGSTGLGHGIALPHARINGVDFAAIDNQPVDLIFGLLVPESATKEHLQLLAYLASMFSDSEFCAQLRQAEDPEEVMQQVNRWNRFEKDA